MNSEASAPELELVDTDSGTTLRLVDPAASEARHRTRAEAFLEAQTIVLDLAAISFRHGEDDVATALREAARRIGMKRVEEIALVE